jgi:hypothetical protein
MSIEDREERKDDLGLSGQMIMYSQRLEIEQKATLQ